MNDYISIRNQHCPNTSCAFYGKKLAENVVLHSQYAKRMRCKACKKTWVAYRNEIRYGLRSDPEKIDEALELFKQGLSIREMALKLKVSTSTIQRWGRKFKIIFINLLLL